MKKILFLVVLVMSPTLLSKSIPLAYEFENSTQRPITISVEGVPGLSMIIDPGQQGRMNLEPGQQVTVVQPYKTDVGNFSRVATVPRAGSYFIGIDGANNLQAIPRQKGIVLDRQPAFSI